MRGTMKRSIPKTIPILWGLAALLVSALLYAQGPAAPAGQAPRAFDIDITGYWTPALHEDALERGGGPELADYGGFALNEAGRLWALSYDTSRLTLRHHQCEAYVLPYQMRAVGNFRIWEERDPHTQRLIAIHVCLASSRSRENTPSSTGCLWSPAWRERNRYIRNSETKSKTQPKPKASRN